MSPAFSSRSDAADGQQGITAGITTPADRAYFDHRRVPACRPDGAGQNPLGALTPTSSLGCRPRPLLTGAANRPDGALLTALRLHPALPSRSCFRPTAHLGVSTPRLCVVITPQPPFSRAFSKTTPTVFSPLTAKDATKPNCPKWLRPRTPQFTVWR